MGGKIKDITGSKIGKLTLIERKVKNGKAYYLCKCECGNEKLIRSDSLTKKNPTLSCGCLAKNTQFKTKDLTGKRFGRLVALEPTNKKVEYNNSIIWKCQCDCGNIYYAPTNVLIQNQIKSCGCFRIEYAKNIVKGRLLNDFKQQCLNDGTNVKLINRDKPMAHNTSGHTGVVWDKSRNKWIAEIRFKNKRYYLGRYEKKEDAIKAREEAEKRFHKEFLKDLNKD